MKKDDLDHLSPVPTATADHRRLESIDILRGLALFGVLSVNLVTEFRVSIFEQFLPQARERDLINRAVIWFVHNALELKAFALFSFLFGVGMAMQFERLSNTGRPLYWLTRRLLVLLSFGLIHLLLIWNGDILTEYALARLMVLPLLYASRKVLGSGNRAACPVPRATLTPHSRCLAGPRLNRKSCSAGKPDLSNWEMVAGHAIQPA
jgi:uncharacterized membrane protein YeiB